MSEWIEMVFSNAVCINPSVSLLRGENYPFVDMSSIDPSSRCVFAKEFRVFNGGGSRFEVGDTLMARITPCLENGKIARFCGVANSKAHGSTEFIVIRGREGVTLNDYAYYLVKWEKVRGYAISQMSGTSGRQRVTASSFDYMYIPVPPLSEQKAIAHILGSLDDKIELNRRMNETLEAMARAIFKDWFVDFGPTRAKIEGRAPYLPEPIWSLFPDAIDPQSGLPIGWEVSTIGEEVKVVGGSTPNTKNPNFWNGGIPWATPKDLSNLNTPVLLETARTITKDGLAKISSGLLPVGTVLLSSRAPVGYLAISEIPIAVNQGFIAMVCERRLSNIFILLWAKENMDVIIQNANGSTFQEISKRNFRPINVVVASPQVLDNFHQNICPLYQRIVSNEIESRTLAELRDRLLPKLMSGEIRVKDAERLVEEVL